MSLRELSAADVIKILSREPDPARTSYLAMYSSWLGGIVRSPELMLVPLDDHMVHRGDAVFEAMKFIDRKIYALDRHLERLERSASLIALKPARSRADIHEICVATARASGASDGVLRLFLSRGPGSFSPNPYDTLGTQLYVVATAHRALAAERLQKGVKARTSTIPIKEWIFSTVKSCNYLPNVLMKKEAVDHGVDFTVSRDERGHLAEGSTENFAIVSKDGEYLVPAFERTLKGVTVARSMELAQDLVTRGLLRGIRHASITVEDVFSAREAMVLGTTIDCLSVTTYDGRQVGSGVCGPVASALNELLWKDMSEGPLVTPI